MKKKVLATACLMSLAVSQAAFADDYVTGDSRYAAPDFQEQKQWSVTGYGGASRIKNEYFNSHAHVERDP